MLLNITKVIGKNKQTNQKLQIPRLCGCVSSQGSLENSNTVRQERNSYLRKVEDVPEERGPAKKNDIPEIFQFHSDLTKAEILGRDLCYLLRLYH